MRKRRDDRVVRRLDDAREVTQVAGSYAVVPGQERLLLELQAAPALRWCAFTVFEPGSGVDGKLYASDRRLDSRRVAAGTELGLPLDVYTFDEVTKIREDGGYVEPLASGVGIAVGACATREDVEAAVRTWCLVNLSREDVAIDPWDGAS